MLVEKFPDKEKHRFKYKEKGELETYERVFGSVLTYFDHCILGGTSTPLNLPLTPYAICSGLKSIQEVKEEREEVGYCGDGFVNYRFKNEEIYRGTGLNYGCIDIKLDEPLKRVISRKIERTKNKGDQMFSFDFIDSTLDLKSGKITMPALVGFDTKSHSLLVRERDGHISIVTELDGKTPQYPVHAVLANSEELNDSTEVFELIDKDGFRFELRE